MSDSLYLEVTGKADDVERLKQAFALCPIQRINAVEQKNNEIVMFNTLCGIIGSRITVTPEIFAEVIIEWLGRNKPRGNSQYLAPDYGSEPDIDGGCEKGWRLITDDKRIYIRPQWLVYHK